MPSQEDFPVQEAVRSQWTGPIISWMIRLTASVRNLVTGSGFTFPNGNRAVITDAAGGLTESDVTAVEVGRLDGVTSNVQTQLNAKVPYSGATGTVDLNDKDLTNINALDADTATFGGATDYSEFESTGFLKLNGEAKAWEDMQFDLAGGKVAAANAPTWETFTTNTSAYSFTVDDYIDLKANEPPHGWAEGTNGSLHAHLAIKTTQSTGADRYAKFTVYLAIADVGDVWTEIGPYTAEYTIPTGTAALTHYLLSLGTVTLTGKNIGLQAKVRVKRIAATGGTEYADRVFITQVGLHLEQDTIGSREIASK